MEAFSLGEFGDLRRQKGGPFCSDVWSRWDVRGCGVWEATGPERSG